MEKARLTPAVGAGFALIAKRPVSVLVWGLVYILLSLAPVAAILAGSAQELIAGYRDLLADPESMAAGPPAIFEKIQRLQGLQLLCSLAVVALVYTAIWRAVLRPEQSSWFSLRLGMAELRTAGVAVVLYVFMVVAILALAIGCAIPVIAIVAVSGGEPSPGATAVLVLLGLGVVIALLPVGARMAMALPMSLAQNRFRLFEAWTLTKGYGWQLAGVFILILLIILAIEIAVVLVGVIVAAVVTGGFDAATMSSMFSQAGGIGQAAPLFIGLGLLYVALVGVILPITVAPWARAYQLIDQAGAPTSTELFE